MVVLFAIGMLALVFLPVILLGVFENAKFAIVSIVLSGIMCISGIGCMLANSITLSSDGYEQVVDASYITESGVIKSFDKAVFKKDGAYYYDASFGEGMLWPFIPHNFQEVETPGIFNI